MSTTFGVYVRCKNLNKMNKLFLGQTVRSAYRKASNFYDKLTYAEKSQAFIYFDSNSLAAINKGAKI